jgi:hypothetical protein
MCAGAHNRSAVIEQTRKDRSEVDASRQQKCAAAMNSGGRSARPVGSSSKNSMSCPAHLQWVSGAFSS